MTRRSTILLPSGRDGTSQTGRRLPALDPDYVAIDERSTADLLAFVQAFAEQIRFFMASSAGDDELRDAGSWSAFAKREAGGNHAAISIADMVAYIADPTRFEGEQARWLGRPHFALLLTFLELLGHARAQLNGLTARHLDYYYREVLRMLPLPALADRAAVVLQLASRVDHVRVPAGTALRAGRDSAGVERIYRTERDIDVNRAQVAALRSVYVHRRITQIPDVRRDASLTAQQTFDRMLALALGTPNPGDAVPAYSGQAIDRAFIVGLGPLLGFASQKLFLDQHELRAMMKLVRRRNEADHEWAEINRLLKLANPAKPRDFAANFAAAVGVLDFEKDGLPQVKNLDDLYEHRAEKDVRAYIDKELAEIGYANFEALMPIKRRIDAEWAEINRYLESVGRRQRGVLAWSLEPADPTAFAANLQKALGSAWPPPWPAPSKTIEEYEARVRSLEAHLSMSAERLAVVSAFVDELGANSEAHELDWTEIDRILIDAHREKVYAARRAELDAVRAGRNDLVGFDAVVAAALDQQDDPPAWTDARATLERYLDRGQLDLLDHFRRQLVDPAAARPFSWADVLRVLELAQRYVEDLPEPVAETVEWRNLYAFADATKVLPDPGSPRWKTFGWRPPAPRESQPPESTLGWALRSPLLALSQGTRTLTLTLGLQPEGFDRTTFLRGLGLTPATYSEENLRVALAGALTIEVSSEEKWIELPLVSAKLAGGKPNDDYWSIRGAQRPPSADRPALQLGLRLDPTSPALAPLGKSGEVWPTLRVLLRQVWDKAALEWTTRYAPFEPLGLAAAHLQVEVAGLVDLAIQHEDQQLDPRKPFEPFGSHPAVGSRLYLSHPELTRARLDMLRVDLTWMGLPASLASRYRNYPGISKAGDLRARLSLVDRNLPLTLINEAPLFRQDAQAATLPDQRIEIANVDASLQASNPGWRYVRRDQLQATRDLRAADRYFQLELGPIDFGHGIYPSLAAEKARALTVGLAQKTVDANNVDNYRVDPPYTPKLKGISVGYRSSVELEPSGPADANDRLLHVHPFGSSRITASEPSLLPRYDDAGELYIGLADAAAPQHVSLLMQLAEGTASSDREPATLEWACLDGEGWQPLDRGNRLFDSTRGLINSGIVELALPSVAPSTRLPAQLYWLRLTIPRDPALVCDTIDVHAQAVTVRFEDQGNAPDHYEQPLPVASIDRLREPDVRIAAITQPYTSFGGKPPEQPSQFRTRVSERLRHKQRALTPWDYERLVLQRFPEVYKAKCLVAGAMGEPGRVDVIVIPDIRQQLPSDAFAPKASANLLADIQAYLAERAPAAAKLRVRNATYVAIEVRLGVRFMVGQDEGLAKRQLNDDLNRFLSPWAYGESAELEIGGKIYANSIIDFVDRRDYVDYVADIKLFRHRAEGGTEPVPRTAADYHVATEAPDQVLVGARQHHIDVIAEQGYSQASFTGINYMKIELDFIVG